MSQITVSGEWAPSVTTSAANTCGGIWWDYRARKSIKSKAVPGETGADCKYSKVGNLNLNTMHDLSSRFALYCPSSTV